MWPSDDDVVEGIRQAGGELAYAKLIGRKRPTVQSHVDNRGLRERVRQVLREQRETTEAGVDETRQRIVSLLKKRQDLTVEDIADQLDVAPKRVRAHLDGLRHDGFRIPEEDSTGVRLEKLPPSKRTVHRSLIDGDDVLLAFVSDTHLSSRECALEHLHLAYDEFVERGITEVYHAGDLVAGRGIYRTQDQDLTNHTFEAQVDHAVRDYPVRKGITTRLISGNHDIEGEFGKVGADPVQAFANQRDDAEYLGAYHAHVELPNGAHFELVHARGGGGYAISYKPQRWVEGLPPGRKPALAMFGHWHIMGHFVHRNVHCFLGGCFEWQTSLLVRLGLQPVVGYWLIRLRLGDDGTVVKVTPEFTQFYEGRVAG